MPKHNIVHVDIPSSDPAKSAQFYSDLFGWGTTHLAEYDYWLYQPEVEPGGGFIKVGEETMGFKVSPSDVIVYVSTDDVEASLQKAVQLGAKVVMPYRPIDANSGYAIFEDPSGTKIGLYTAAATEDTAS